MTTWQRLNQLGGIQSPQSDETWLYTPPGSKTRQFPMQITNGKPFNVLSLKGTDLDETRKYAEFLNHAATKLYEEGQARRRFERCPCCNAETETHAQQCYEFIGTPFHRCTSCGHGFVLEQPTEETLHEVFADSDDHSATYVDHDSLEGRMREIIAPKLEWTLDVYSDCHRRDLETAIDVGAGGGHFVAGLQRAGKAATGYELSNSSRAFAREAFGIDLIQEDFLTAQGEPVDLVTFWGLLEYTPEPLRFLEAARNRLHEQEGLLVVEVPRIESLGTAVQAENPNQIARHMDPTSHINTYSDSSLATALVETGFRPVAAWYFGMDIYEMLIQSALRMEQVEVIDRLADMIPSLQAVLDHGRQCDDLVIAAVPE